MTHVKTRKNSEAKRAYRKEGSKSRSRRRRRRRRKRRAENKKKVTTGVNLRSRFALNFDFTIVVLAISPLAKSSLKGFRSFFYFFSLFFSLYNPHCHDFTSPMSLVVSSPSYTLSPFRYAHKPIPSYADSFSLAHFFFPLLLSLFLHFLPANLLSRVFPRSSNLPPRGYFTFVSTRVPLLFSFSYLQTRFITVFFCLLEQYIFIYSQTRRFFVRKSLWILFIDKS